MEVFIKFFIKIRKTGIPKGYWKKVLEIQVVKKQHWKIFWIFLQADVYLDDS